MYRLGVCPFIWKSKVCNNGLPVSVSSPPVFKVIVLFCFETVWTGYLPGYSNLCADSVIDPLDRD